MGRVGGVGQGGHPGEETYIYPPFCLVARDRGYKTRGHFAFLTYLLIGG